MYLTLKGFVGIRWLGEKSYKHRLVTYVKPIDILDIIVVCSNISDLKIEHEMDMTNKLKTARLL